MTATTGSTHADFNWRTLTVWCPTVGSLVTVTKTFNRCEGCGEYVS